MEPTRVHPLKAESCPCGNVHLGSQRMEPFYTHQVIELPEIEMDVTHYVLHRTRCRQCGRVVKAAVAPVIFAPDMAPGSAHSSPK